MITTVELFQLNVGLGRLRPLTAPPHSPPAIAIDSLEVVDHVATGWVVTSMYYLELS
jgi:hypothetical protein